MEKTTAELTTEYVNEHPHIKNCLKKGMINYSSLARVIAKELKIEKSSSKEAILVAARRFHEKLKNEKVYEKDIVKLLEKSDIEIKNKICIFILEKQINLDHIDEIQKNIRKHSGVFYILEGSDNYTIIIQQKYSNLIEKKFRQKINIKNQDLVMINIKSPKEIETTQGVISYLTSLFSQNGVNIYEFLSCWTDTIFIISSKDLNKTISFLDF